MTNNVVEQTKGDRESHQRHDSRGKQLIEDKDTASTEEVIKTSSDPLVKTNRFGYPYSIFFIISNEFCERFSFYGMKAILPIYLTGWLGFKEASATTIIHSFNFSCYFFSILGGILSDNFLGKFRTILYLSIVYCVGNAVMSLTALPGWTGTQPHWWGAALGLVLIGLGTGGIKPCVASFGGDQFDITQAAKLTFFFSLFYFAINLGSVLSMFLTPILRSRVHCFGQESCYPLAFGVPAILMFVALIIFWTGSRLYRKEAIRNNVVVLFISFLASVSVEGIRRGFRKISFRSNPNQQKILDSDVIKTKFAESFIEQSMRVLSVFKVFIPVCIFWALYDQQGSWWVYQAVMMKSQVSLFGWSFTILPEQMGLANAFLILALIPIFSHLLYPGLNKANIQFPALTRMLTGMILALLSFVMAAILQFWMNSVSTYAPSPKDAGLMVCESGCVSILWQLPQYFAITCAEVFLSVTGLEFSYSQAPVSMKSVCQAGWLLTVAGGNLFVIIVTLVDPVGWFIKGTSPNSNGNSMAWNFILWAGLITLGSLLFYLLSRGYRYQEEAVEEVFIIENEPSGSKKEEAERERNETGVSLSSTDQLLS